jgi:hypothetical protein
MLMSPLGLRSGDAQQKLKTRDTTSLQRGRYTSTNLQLSKNNQREKEEKLVADPRWVPDTKTDWPTERRS